MKSEIRQEFSIVENQQHSTIDSQKSMELRKPQSIKHYQLGDQEVDMGPAECSSEQFQLAAEVRKRVNIRIIPEPL